MVHCNYCLCFLAVLPASCAATVLSTHSSAVHLGRQTHLKRSEEHGAHPMKRIYDPPRHGYHGWHYSSPPADHTSKFTNSEMEGPGPGMVPERKKEDEQKDSTPTHSGVVSFLSPQSDGSGSPSAAPSLATLLASANTPVSSAISIDSTSAVSSSFQSQSQSEGQATQSQHALTTLATASSSSPSSAFSPALLAFILVPVCVFLLGMAFALYRIYGRPGNRVPRTSPMFLGDSTALGSGYHKDEAIAMNESTEYSRNSPLGYHIDKRESIKWEPRFERNPSTSSANTVTGNIRDPRASHGLMPPFHTQSAGSHHTPPSRVLRPHVSRPYNRPHPAFTTDPESVIPLIVNSSKNRIYKNGQDGYATSKETGKGKENVFHRQSHHARKHRADISTTPLNTSPRSLPFKDPVISAVFSDMDIRLQARTKRSPASSVSVTKDKNQLEVPSQSSTLKSSSFDIGIAMLTGFSSPNVGLGLDLSPCPPPLTHNLTKKLSHPSESQATGESTNRNSALPYLDDSSTVGSKGLAYLSGSSPETILTDKLSEVELVQDELDIASALAVYRVQHAGDRLKDQKAPVDQMPETQRGGNENNGRDSLASSPSSETRYAPSEIKAPTLPTLSEMALSRADPLYESVTNELFSTYGMRMSTVNGVGQKSRVSARISRMLSWFAGADAGNAGSSMMSGVENRVSREDSSLSFSGEGHGVRMSNMSSPGGVQPLRIGKASKNAA